MAESIPPQPSLSEAEMLVRKFAEAGGDLAVNLAVAAVILFLTLWGSGKAAGLMRRLSGRAHRFGPPDTTLQSFAASLTRYTVLVVGFVAVLQQLGVQTTSVIAVLGAASLAVGLALQGALSNVAAGVMILVLRPYRVGDVIEAAGKQGVVRALDLFVTELATFDNVQVFVPNAKVLADVITNMSAHSMRRVDVVFRIAIARDADAILKSLAAAADADPRVLKQPAPATEIIAITELYCEAAVRMWAARADYAAVRADFFARARLQLDVTDASGALE